MLHLAGVAVVDKWPVFASNGLNLTNGGENGSVTNTQDVIGYKINQNFPI